MFGYVWAAPDARERPIEEAPFNTGVTMLTRGC
jgi:hypothetical protein